MNKLFKITVPLIMPIVRVAALFLMLGVFKGFENILILTNGGPSGSTDVIGLYMFNTGLRQRCAKLWLCFGNRHVPVRHYGGSQINHR